MAMPAIVKNVKVPEGRHDMNPNEFRTFSKDCRDYKKLTKYSDEQIVLQVRLNMDTELKRAIDVNIKDAWDAYTVEEAIDAIGTLLKSKHTPVVYRKEFDRLSQHEGEDFKTFVTRLKACAADCDFTCPHDDSHCLIEYHLINKIRSGIHDPLLQQEILQKSDTLNTLEKISAHCENYEAAKQDQEKLSSATNASIATSEEMTEDEVLAAISQYKRKKNGTQERKTIPKKKCMKCGYDWPHGPDACPAKGRECKSCGKMNHFESVCLSKNKEVSALIIGTIQRICSMSDQKKSLPKLKVVMKTKMNKGPMKIDVVADTGAQVTAAGDIHMKHFGLTLADLTPPDQELRHAGGRALDILGSYTVSISHNDQTITDEIYFVKGVNNVYLSCDSCRGIRLIHKEFPNVKVSQTPLEINNNSLAEQTTKPDTKLAIPYPPTEENVPKLEQYLLKKFSKTVFNVIDPIPHMEKPMHIHLNEDAKPCAVHTPIPTPIHLREKMTEVLKQQVYNKFIQKVPVGEATPWCARAVPVVKKDGGVRLTVDYQKLNEQCERETYHTPRPFDVVSNVPPRTFKTVLDAFSGYNQVLLDEDSIKLTTFISDIGGRYQNLRAPQGYKGSGDAFNRRYDDIMVDLPRKGKVVDDIILWDNSVGEAFYHTLDLLLLCEKHGVTLKPSKFRFSRKEVDFCSYTVGWEGFRPSDESISAIRDFPMPSQPTITDIRSWFGLVNQLAPFIATAEIMAPFRDLLKSTELKSRKVYWDAQLQQAFEKTKDALCEIAANGLNFFDMNKETILVTDWSKVGIGFTLLQKHCKCSGEVTPLCCKSGWKLALCNSRHVHPSEFNYHPVEGEALAVTWALKKARMFLLGCPRFTIFVDQKPLLKILGDKSLADIEITRLLNLKQKTLPYNFNIKHIKGLKNHADILSRYPVNTPDEEDVEEALALNAIMTSMTVASVESALLVSWPSLKEHCDRDEDYQTLLKKVRDKTFSDTFNLEDACVKEYFNVRDRLTVVDNVVMYAYEGNELRTVIPKKLRHQMILNIHAAHQGATSIISRARKIMYWPGMDRDIKMHAETCKDCQESAPSQVKEPMTSTEVPMYPFQHAASDLFEINGHHYLVYVDHLTAFAELAYYPTAPSSSKIISTFREFFHRWGVVEKVSLDGGPNLDSHEMKQWLEKWGVTVRQSSALS